MTVSTTALTTLDPKRYFWLAAMFWGALPLLFIFVAYQTGQPLWVWAYFLIIFVVMPLLDRLLGASSYNIPEEAYGRLRKDGYYKWVARFTAIIPYATQLVAAWYITTYDVSILAYLGFAFATGWAMGLAVNAAHEVGHKNTAIDHWFARLGLVPSFMGHFRIEHNYGHHADVATPKDTATARMGQSYYAFVFKEIPGGMRRAWAIEKNRLSRKNISVFSWKNEVVKSAVLSVLYWAVMLFVFGWIILPFLVIAAVQSNLLLSSANYIEHYGLLRQKLPNGKYEPCQPHHSWNSNRFLSNLLILHLERHSDHHAYAQRPYQCLRHYDNVPQLPAGYLPMFVLSWIPPLWYKVMDKRVAAWAKGDMTKVLVDDAKKEKLYTRWHTPHGKSPE